MTAKPLEELIRESAQSGALNYLSIAHTAAGWEVAYRGVDDRDHRMVSHADPVCAILSAMTGKPGDAPPRRKQRTTTAKLPAAKPTARTDYDDLLG